MNHSLKNASKSQLKALLDEATRNFIDALDTNKSTEELKAIRGRIQDILHKLKILENDIRN